MKFKAVCQIEISYNFLYGYFFLTLKTKMFDFFAMKYDSYHFRHGYLFLYEKLIDSIILMLTNKRLCIAFTLKLFAE